MKALVIYDSVFGNTETIARAIGTGLGAPVWCRWAAWRWTGCTGWTC